jgi:ABC-type glycerol-3-phosphate transport system substrate-binding protein
MKSTFSIIVVVIFIALALFAVLVFAGLIPLGKQKQGAGSLGTVTLWGTIKQDTMDPIIEKFNGYGKAYRVRYVAKFPETFDQELLEALASGTGPDLFFMPNDLVLGYINKIKTIPYESYPIASFTNTFASAGEVFLTSKGVLALPLSIDPLMMYYNRSILDSENIIYPPTTWDEMAELSAKITQRDEGRQLIRSTVPLGQYSNIRNAKDILATLFMQAGNNIIEENSSGTYFATLNETKGLDRILAFYTDFSDPLKETYSWNKSLPNSQDAFSAEKVAFYFGFASELGPLINKNPNQNFLVAQVPQIKNSNFKLTHSRVTGVAVSAFSKKASVALMAASEMAIGEFSSDFAKALGIAPARRDLLAKPPVTDAFNPAFYSSALIAKSWLDPSPVDTNNVFRRVIDGILSNVLSPEDGISDANGKLQLLLLK